jgi:inositol phosphorylceramide mannosyltransferase catalytic subunit
VSSVAQFVRDMILILARHIYELVTPRETDVSPIYFSVPASRARIPNRVYQTWETPLIPSLMARGIRRFRRLNPDYSFSFFDAEARADYMERHYAGHPILTVFRDLKIRTAQVDVWRYCILYREGGIYCDIDSAMGVPLRQIIREEMPELISFERNLWRDTFDPAYADAGAFMSSPPASARAKFDHPDHVILNWMMCFEREHPILKEAIDLIVHHFSFFQGKRFASALKAIIHCTGPLALTQAAWRWLATSDRRPCQCGIDFNGQAILTLPGSGRRHTVSNPHYVGLGDVVLTRSGIASGAPGVVE